MFRLFQNRSYFLKFLFSYLMILLVPFLTIIITYAAADISIRREILNSNQNSLHQFFSHVDTQLSEMVQTSFNVMQNHAVKKRSYDQITSTPEKGYETYKIKEYLAAMPRDTFSDVFLYYYRSDSVISADFSSLTSETYSKIYYGELAENPADTANRFRERLTLRKGNTPYLISLGRAQTRPNLAVVMAQNVGYMLAEPDMTACVVLKPALLETILQSANTNRDSIILILDEQGEPLASSSGNFGKIDCFQYKNGETMEECINGQKYMVQTFKSNVLNCTYLSLTPTSTFWEHLNLLRVICLVSMLICMVVTAMVTVFLTRRNYHPITTLLNTIKSETNHTYNRSEANELEFARSILQELSDKNALLFSQIENENQALQTDFLLRALQGTWHQEQDDAYEFSTHRIQLLSGQFGVVLLHIEDFDANAVGGRGPVEMQKILLFILSNVFNELSSRSHQGFLIELSPMRYAGILNYHAVREEGLLESALTEDTLRLCDEFSDFLRNNFGILCTLALSEVQSGLTGLHLAYSQAMQAMTYRFVCGKGKTISYHSIKGRSFLYNSVADSKATQILLNYVQQDAAGVPENIVRQISDWLNISPEASYETFQCYKYEIANTVNRISHQIIALSEAQKNGLLHGLLEAETFADYQACLAKTIEKLRLLRAENMATNTVCDKAAAYISDHYADPNLNNNSISEALGISPSYLSKLFKAQFNLSPLDFLYQLRVERAKELLRKTSLTVEEIAQQTGFLAGSALIKIFRKIEGITPGSYRKMTRNSFSC